MVAALFVRANSPYKSIPGVDCYDADRDALTWSGGVPGVFHPPCRGWGKLVAFSKHTEEELYLARWSMFMVRKFGGVVEHPYDSRLWADSNCLSFGVRDEYGGILIPIYQSWWGHRAAKKSAIYVVGPCPDLPDYEPPNWLQKVANMGKSERERTPVDFAHYLVELASRCTGWAQRLNIVSSH